MKPLRDMAVSQDSLQHLRSSEHQGHSNHCKTQQRGTTYYTVAELANGIDYEGDGGMEIEDDVTTNSGNESDSKLFDSRDNDEPVMMLQCWEI
jgi:hypothetical protein